LFTAKWYAHFTSKTKCSEKSQTSSAATLLTQHKFHEKSIGKADFPVRSSFRRRLNAEFTSHSREQLLTANGNLCACLDRTVITCLRR